MMAVNNEDDQNENLYGYWTNTIYSQGSTKTAIMVVRDGSLSKINPKFYPDSYGLRPVITVSKSIIDK